MKGPTLYEPYASAVERGLKLMETRSWPTSYRGLLAIHAAQKKPDASEIEKRMVEAGILNVELAAFLDWRKERPLGKIVAVTQLVDCVRTEIIAPRLTQIERTFGDYSPGRWAWILMDVRPLSPYIACKGMQGLWEVPLGIAYSIAVQNLKPLPGVLDDRDGTGEVVRRSFPDDGSIGFPASLGGDQDA